MREKQLQKDGQHYAGFWIRLASYLIDVLLMNLFAAFISLILHQFLSTYPVYFSFLKSGQFSRTASALNIVLTFSVFWTYQILMIGKYQASLGEMVLHLKVVGIEGRRISYGLAAYRQIVGFLASALALGLGFFWILWDPYKQGWHDTLAGTYVIHAPRTVAQRQSETFRRKERPQETPTA